MKTLLQLIIQLVAVAAMSFLGSALVGAVKSSSWLTLILGVAVAAAAVVGYAWVVRLTEKRTVAEVGRDGARRALGLGTLAGVILFALVIVGITVSGDYRVTDVGSIPGMLWILGFMAAGAVTEELLFRGVLFRHVERWFGTWVALVGTGLVFGLIHLTNPDATLVGAISIALEAGGMLGAAYVATRSLWLPIGLHFGWNFAENGLFGTEVSGNGTHEGLLHAATSGSSVISGGQFGPEASIFAVIVCLAAAVVFMRMAYRRGHVVPARLPRRTTPTPTATLAG